MKKILLALIVISAATQLKAQQLNTKPADPQLLFKAPKSLPVFKLADSSLFKNFTPLTNLNQLQSLASLNANTTELVYSTMPIARMGGNIDNMSVIKPVESNMHYPMLIKKVKVVDPLATVKPTP